MPRTTTLVFGVVIVLLLTPTLSCALPFYSMNSSENDCCRQMKMQECSQANMSSCCTIVAPNLVMQPAAATKKLLTVSSTSQSYCSSSVAAELTSTFAVSSQATHMGGPPPLDSISSIQVLRI